MPDDEMGVEWAGCKVILLACLLVGILLGAGGMLLWTRRRGPNSSMLQTPPSDLASRLASDIEELTKIFMSSTEDTFVLMDSEMRVVDINHLAEFPVGTRKEDLVGRKVTDISPAMGESGWHHRFRTVIDTGRALTGEDEIPHPGRGATGRVSITAIRLGDRMGLLARDLTNQQRLDELLEWGKARWESLVRHFPALVVVLDEAGTIRFLNHAVTEPDVSRVVGRSFLDFMAPEYRETASATLAKVLKDGGEGRFEAQGYHFDGRTAWYDVRMGRIAGRERARSAIVVATDISGRIEAERALKDVAETYRAFFETVPSGILVADVDTMRIQYANRTACAMFGLSLEEFLTKSLPDIHPRKDLAFVIGEFRAQAQGEKALAESIPCLRKDGSVFYADFRTAPAMINGRQCNVGFVTVGD